MTLAELQKHIQVYWSDLGHYPAYGYLNLEDAEQVIKELDGLTSIPEPYPCAGLQICGVDFLKVPTLPKGSVAFRHP